MPPLEKQFERFAARVAPTRAFVLEGRTICDSCKSLFGVPVLFATGQNLTPRTIAEDALAAVGARDRGAVLVSAGGAGGLAERVELADGDPVRMVKIPIGHHSTSVFGSAISRIRAMNVDRGTSPLAASIRSTRTSLSEIP